ncbi:synaptotagmin-3-like [Elaeis guineensis]|uniref:synaptotagmin-3-like n=1 Tax=Elaeis guineensis var. tenera TaxID=51953 RepID=UPI003C6D13E2
MGEVGFGTFRDMGSSIEVYDTQEKQLVIEPGIHWAGNANITVNLKLLSLEVTVQLLDLQIFLVPQISLKPLVPSFSCFANLSVSLMEKPCVDFGLKLLGGDIMAIPVLYRFIQETVAVHFSNLYHWPKVLEAEVLILDSASGATKKPVGILYVKIVCALNLRKMNFLGKSDAYVKLSLSRERLPLRKPQ